MTAGSRRGRDILELNEESPLRNNDLCIPLEHPFGVVLFDRGVLILIQSNSRDVGSDDIGFLS